MKHLRLVILSLVLVCLTIAPAMAQNSGGGINFGVRAGYTNWDDLNQGHMGVHLHMGEILPNVFFRPNFEVGLGDGANLYILNADLAYSFTEFVSWPWNLYGGGAFSVNWVKFEHFDTQSTVGLNAVAGLEYSLSNGHQSMIEFRFGLKDSPDFKFTVGYTIF